MSLNDMDAAIQRLLVRERSRRVLSAQREQQLRERLRRVAAAAPARVGLHHRLRFLWLHPLLMLGLLLLGGGVAVAIVNAESSWWTGRWPTESRRVPRPSQVTPPNTEAPAAPVMPVATDVGASLRAEVALIGRARRELATGKPEAAARSLSAHAQRFPEGSLLQEREGLAVMVLWHRGHHGLAKQAAKRFEMAHPKSPMNRPLKELMESAR